MVVIPSRFWWWLTGVVGAWLIIRGLNILADQAGARQRAVDRATAEFGLN